MTSTIQKSPYLRNQRQFPFEELRATANEMDHAYIDIAQKVNDRTIGIFALNNKVVTGENWFLKGGSTKQQTLRQLYSFTSAGNIVHGLNLATITTFTRIYGVFYDGSVYYPLPYVDVVNANNQVGIKVGATNIVIAAGAGSPPTIASGYVVLEWLSQI